MIFTKEQRHEAYNKLSEETQTFVTSDEVTNVVEKTITALNLDENTADKLDSRIYYTMIGLQTVQNLSSALQDEFKISLEHTTITMSALTESIFSKIEILKDTGVYLANTTETSDVITGSPSALLESPSDLIASNQESGELYDLSRGTSLEEKISLHVGSPAAKAAWEERKEKVTDTIATGSKYENVDPYREPLS